MPDTTKSSEIDNLQDLIALRHTNVGRLFQRAARAYSENALYKLREYGYDGLTLFHTALISNLDVAGTRISILAERAGVSKQAMGQLVAELEERGFITRSSDPDDKRATLIHFTEQGRQFLQVACQVKQAIEVEYAAILGDANMRALREMLQQIIDTN